MGYRPCERCHGTGRVNSMMCPICNGTGSIREAFHCPVCSGRYYVPRNPPIQTRCPHCGSLLMTYWNSVQVLERGTVPIPPPGSKTALGAIGGGTIGLAVGGPVGGFLGLIFGGILGAASEAPREAEEV